MTTTAGTISGDTPPADGSRYDAIVVGAGHNGLIAAGYLAKAGKKVLVLERRSIIGGATVTEEWFPGYHLSTCSYVCNLLLPEVIADLELERHGYDVRPFDPQYFVPFPDGSLFHELPRRAQDERADRQVLPTRRRRLRRLLGDVGPHPGAHAAVAAATRARRGIRSRHASPDRRVRKTGGR